jgi:hypothetical protein
MKRHIDSLIYFRKSAISDDISQHPQSDDNYTKPVDARAVSRTFSVDYDKESHALKFRFVEYDKFV